MPDPLAPEKLPTPEEAAAAAAKVEFPGGPKAGEPVPRDPIDGIDLPTFAKISAELAEGDPPREAILRAVGFDELRWTFVEQGWMLRVATAALRGDPSLAHELNEQYVAAQDSLGPVEPTHALDRYAFLVAHAEKGVPLPPVLKAEGLGLAGFARLQRAWTKRLVADEALASTFRGWVEQVKKQL